MAYVSLAEYSGSFGTSSRDHISINQAFTHILTRWLKTHEMNSRVCQMAGRGGWSLAPLLLGLNGGIMIKPIFSEYSCLRAGGKIR